MLSETYSASKIGKKKEKFGYWVNMLRKGPLFVGFFISVLQIMFTEISIGEFDEEKSFVFW